MGSSRWLFLLIGVALVNQAFAQGIFAALGPTRALQMKVDEYRS